MAVLIYSEQAGDKLKLLAEVGEDNVELAVDALLDAEPKLENQQPFVVFPVDARMIVAVGEVVRPRRDIQITGGTNGASAKTQEAPKRRGRPRKTQPEVAQGEVETDPDLPTEEAPKRTRKAGGNGRRKPAAAKGSAKKGGSPFKRNPKSDE
jgi:hypothetical protein